MKNVIRRIGLLSLLGAVSVNAYSAAYVTYLNYNVATGMLTTTVGGVYCTIAADTNTNVFNSQLDMLASALMDAKTGLKPIIWFDCNGKRIQF